MNQGLTELVFAFPSDLGWMAVCFFGDSVTRTTFGHRQENQAIKAVGGPPVLQRLTTDQQSIVDRLKAFARGEPERFDDVPIRLDDMTNFQRRALHQCRELHWGETASYGSIARRAGRPQAARAVGTAMAKNPVPLIIPCHRVVSASGLGGFSAPGGCHTKQKLLHMESTCVSQR
jgi:O-6-methylguanine DNA methyltransferase